MFQGRLAIRRTAITLEGRLKIATAYQNKSASQFTRVNDPLAGGAGYYDGDQHFGYDL